MVRKKKDLDASSGTMSEVMLWTRNEKKKKKKPQKTNQMKTEGKLSERDHRTLQHTV